MYFRCTKTTTIIIKKQKRYISCLFFIDQRFSLLHRRKVYSSFTFSSSNLFTHTSGGLYGLLFQTWRLSRGRVYGGERIAASERFLIVAGLLKYGQLRVVRFCFAGFLILKSRRPLRAFRRFSENYSP